MKKLLNNIFLNPVFSGSAVMVIGSNSINFLNYIYHLIMGRLLGPVGYGELVTLISILGLMGIIPSTMSLVVIKYVSSAKTEEEISNIVNWIKEKAFKISVVTFLLIILISPIIKSFLHVDNILYIFLLAVSFLFSFQSVLNRSILQGILKFKEMIISVLLENTTKLLLGVALVYISFGVSGVMLGLTASIIIGWYITTLFSHRKKKKIIEVDFKPMILFAAPVVVYTLSTTSLFTSDLILVKHFFSAHEAGLYAALSTLGKIIFFATGPISSVMFPLVSKRFSQGSNYRKVFFMSFIITAFFALSILFVYWVAPDFIIKLLYGSDYLREKTLLIWFGLFITLFTFSSLIINFNLSLGRTKVVIFPVLAAICQLVFITYFHQSLFMVISICNVITALLLASLLLYSSLEKVYGNKINLSHSACI